MWITPITDRTDDDVRNRTSKGIVQAEDLNRIEGDEQYLAELLCVSIILPVTWTDSGIPLTSDHVRIVDNAITLRSCSYISSPQIPQIPLNTWQKFNALEQNLSDMYEYALQKTDDIWHCGDGYAGQTIEVI